MPEYIGAEVYVSVTVSAVMFWSCQLLIYIISVLDSKSHGLSIHLVHLVYQ